MANSGLVIISLLMIICDRLDAINQKNARILRRETLPDGTIQVIRLPHLAIAHRL